jgi:hypothetical protein
MSRRTLIAVAATIVVIGLVVAIMLPQYADYEPHSKVSEALGAAEVTAVGEELSLDCANSAAAPSPQRIATAAAIKRNSPVVAGQNLSLLQSRAVSLEIKFNEIRWGAPWRTWSIAIPAGSSLAFEGRCVGPQRFAWRVARSTVPLEFLPRALREQVR